MDCYGDTRLLEDPKPIQSSNERLALRSRGCEPAWFLLVFRTAFGPSLVIAFRLTPVRTLVLISSCMSMQYPLSLSLDSWCFTSPHLLLSAMCPPRRITLCDQVFSWITTLIIAVNSLDNIYVATSRILPTAICGTVLVPKLSNFTFIVPRSVVTLLVPRNQFFHY